MRVHVVTVVPAEGDPVPDAFAFETQEDAERFVAAVEAMSEDQFLGPSPLYHGLDPYPLGAVERAVSDYRSMWHLDDDESSSA